VRPEDHSNLIGRLAGPCRQWPCSSTREVQAETHPLTMRPSAASSASRFANSNEMEQFECRCIVPLGSPPTARVVSTVLDHLIIRVRG